MKKRRDESQIDAISSLREAALGCDLQIESVAGSDCSQLRNLGFCEQARVRKITKRGRNLICSVCGSRLAISNHLAEQVQVRKISSS